MPSPPPRLVPTVVLAAAWVALYLLYLAVKPDPPAPSNGRTTTTTSATSPTGGEEGLSLPAVPAPVPGPAG